MKNRRKREKQTNNTENFKKENQGRKQKVIEEKLRQTQLKKERNKQKRIEINRERKMSERR